MAFAEVLEQELASFQSFRPIAEPPPVFPPRPPHPFLFAAPQRQFGATAYRMGPGRGPTSLDTRPVTPQPPPRPRPRRALTARQERALVELVALGADLRADFSLRELRSAYRTLARRYHPDRHPASGEAEKARLAKVFGELNDNHRRLLAVVASAEELCS